MREGLLGASWALLLACSCGASAPPPLIRTAAAQRPTEPEFGQADRALEQLTPVPALPDRTVPILVTEDSYRPGLTVTMWSAGATVWNVKVTNLGDAQIVLHWDGSTFLTEHGIELGRLMQEGADASKTQTAAIIGPGVTLTTKATPEALLGLPPNDPRAFELMHGGLFRIAFWTPNGRSGWDGKTERVDQPLSESALAFERGLPKSTVVATPPSYIPPPAAADAETEWLASLDSAKNNHGKYPTSYKSLVRSWFTKTLKDPYSAKYGGVTRPRKEHAIEDGSQHKAIFGWSVCATVNAKNGFGAYVGNTVYWFLIADGAIARTQELEQSTEIYIGREINCADGP